MKSSPTWAAVKSFLKFVGYTVAVAALAEVTTKTELDWRGLYAVGAFAALKAALTYITIAAKE